MQYIVSKLNKKNNIS